MKNILGTEENLELFNENGVKVYEYFKWSDGYWDEYTYDSQGKVLTYKDSDGYWYEYTRDSKGNELTYKNSDGYIFEYTHDSNGYSFKCTRDSNRYIYDIPKCIMEKLISKLGNFKIKK